ncbi:MAG: hypothetical protein NC218_08580 [Acetobacter sp.]|nr:hypothetical protein [Acetobacter sp.]
MTRIILRNDSKANWESLNPTLALGEIGVDTDAGRFKIGDGLSAWNSLPYSGSSESGGELDKYLKANSTDNNTTISADGKAITLDAPTIAVGDNLVNNINGEDSELYLKQGDIEGSESITVTKTATGVKLESSGGGSVDAYTKAETDELLNNKENKITAVSPLTLIEKIISTLEGISESNNTISTQYQNIITYNGRLGDGKYYRVGSYSSRIICPYTLGQVVKYPYNKNAQSAVLFGHPTEDGADFAVSAIAFPQPNRPSSGYDLQYQSGGIHLDGCTVLPTSAVTTRNFSTSASEHAANASSTDTNTQYCYAQIVKGGGGELVLGKFGRIYSLDRNILSTDVFRDGQADVPAGITANALAGITHVMWVLGPASTSYSKDLIGLYDVKDRMPWNFEQFRNEWEPSLGESLLDLSKNIASNYLELQVGDGLSVVDGKLTASGGSAPENMVTTDTAQEISGNKTFTNKIQFGALARNSISTYKDILQIGARNNIATEIAINANIIKDRDGNEYLKSSYNAFKQVKLTQDEYDKLDIKEEDTLYIITEE